MQAIITVQVVVYSDLTHKEANGVDSHLGLNECSWFQISTILYDNITIFS